MHKKSKKVAIVTIDSLNYGNKLQNYAMQQLLESLDCEVKTLKRTIPRNRRARIKERIREWLQVILRTKGAKFTEFSRKIHWSKDYVTADYAKPGIEKQYDYFIAGSDQVWNPHYNFVGKSDFLVFAYAEQKIAYAASMGVSELSKEKAKTYAEYLRDFKFISMREEAGAKIIETLIERKVPVVLDPTLMLDTVHWRKIERRPSRYPKREVQFDKPYVLIYLLGEKSKRFDEVLEDICKNLKYNVINCREKNKLKKEWAVGPAEFIYLIDNAEIVLTDSFHASVFSIIFHTKFFVFDRQDIAMKSRLDTLLNVTGLEQCKGELYSSKIINTINFEYADRQLAIKQVEAKAFLENALS